MVLVVGFEWFVRGVERVRVGLGAVVRGVEHVRIGLGAGAIVVVGAGRLSEGHWERAARGEGEQGDSVIAVGGRVFGSQGGVLLPGARDLAMHDSYVVGVIGKGLVPVEGFNGVYVPGEG